MGIATPLSPQLRPVSIEFSISPSLNPNWIQDPNTGNFYEYVSTTGDWNLAQTNADNQSYFGLQGYLATITSATENSLISGLVSSGSAWLGANDEAVEGEWRWVTGPEAGTQFWQGTGTGNSVGGAFESWNPGEPNNSGDEDYAHINSTGVWDDLPGNSLLGYIVEYGGLESALQLTATTTIKCARS